MKQEDAVRDLRMFMAGLQKTRSVLRETLSTDLSTLEGAFPWLFGDKCPLEPLSKVLDAVESGGTLEPQAYYNLMFILFHFMPEIHGGLLLMYPDFRQEAPSFRIIAEGWEA